MSEEIKNIKPISADEVYPVSMKRLADRPNSSSAQGRGGMSASELKGFMDKYPALVKERLNELINLVNAGSKDGLTAILKTPVVDETTGKEISLYEWIVQAGKTHESLQAEVDKKLNKATKIPDDTRKYVYLIAKVNEEVGVFLYEAAITNEPGAFVVRNNAGNIFITQAHVSDPPVDGDNIATKEYVDKNVASTEYIDAGLEKKVDKIVPASAYSGRRLYAATKRFGIMVTNASYNYIKVNGASVDGTYQLKNGDVITITSPCWLLINGTEYRSTKTLNLSDTDITIGTTMCPLPSISLTVTINFSITGKEFQYDVEYTSLSKADTVVGRDANCDSKFSHVFLIGTPKEDNHAVNVKYLNSKLGEKLDKSGGTITGDLVIGQNLVVKGKTQTVDAEILKVADKLIVVASGNTAPLTSPAGILAPKYDGENYGALVFDNTGVAMVGDVVLDADGNIDSSKSDLQALATRKSAGQMASGALLCWNGETEQIETAGDATLSEDSAGGTVPVRNHDRYTFKVGQDGLSLADYDDFDTVPKGAITAYVEDAISAAITTALNTAV